jgi:putative tryptophan/tyrosine transport system substrate-binding protein
MRLIGLAVILAVGLVLAPLAAEAQQPGKVYRVGILSGGSPEKNAPQIETFLKALHDMGWIDGQNAIIEWRSAEGRTDRLGALAAELVHIKVDVIVTVASTPATVAVKRATTTIPVVMVAAGAPVETGLVASLARPGGNITGSTTLGGEVASKRLDFVKELIPKATQVALLWNPDNPANASLYRELMQKTQQAQLKLLSVEVRYAKEFDKGFALLERQRPDALLLTGDPMHLVHMGRVIEFTAKHQLPAIYNVRESVLQGGLMSYGANQPELYKRAATYVDRILKGSKPADLPVEQPTKFELLINLKTARALRLTIPRTLILQADQVIE